MGKVKQYYEEILYMKRMESLREMAQFARLEADYLLESEAYLFEDNHRAFEPITLTDIKYGE